MLYFKVYVQSNIPHSKRSRPTYAGHSGLLTASWDRKKKVKRQKSISIAVYTMKGPQASVVRLLRSEKQTGQ